MELRSPFLRASTLRQTVLSVGNCFSFVTYLGARRRQRSLLGSNWERNATTVSVPSPFAFSSPIHLHAVRFEKKKKKKSERPVENGKKIASRGMILLID